MEINSTNKKVTRRLKGIVVSKKMAKTAVVEVEHWRQHQKYLKQYRISKRFKAHTDDDELNVGDAVLIEETRPLSREKRWRVIQKLETKK